MDEPESSQQGADHTLRGRILLVEDNDLQASLMTAAIESLGEGWQAVRANSAEEALSILEGKAFSAAIVDYVLPRSSGLDVLREIRKRGWAIATVLVTSHGSEELAVEALRLGVSDYIRKDRGYLDVLPGVLRRIVAEHQQRLQELSAYSRLRVELAHRSQRGLLDNFTAPIVHDIKNPLTKISLLAEILLRNGDGTNIPDAASMILGGVKSISNLVERLLMFSRQENEERQSIDLGELLTRLLRREADHLRLQNVRLITQIPPQKLMVRAAPGAIQQVFLNLVANAAEMLVLTRSGGTIIVTLKEENGQVESTVIDDGPGIAPQIMDQLFKPFSTFGKGSRGTGLGLSIVAGIVREHAGTIEAANVPGAGAQFVVRLPSESNGPVALILEDEPYVQELMQSQLAAIGIRGEAYGDGSHILPLLSRGKWDVVILDIRTPGVGGLQVFKEILNQRPDLSKKTMVVSGCIEDRDLQDMLAAHPVPCLPKPYTIRQFDDVVRLLLRGSWQR